MSDDIKGFKANRFDPMTGAVYKQCAAMLPTGAQCHNETVANGNNCLSHGGNKQLQAAKSLELRNYRLTQFRAQMQRLSGSDHIKSLRDEIGILRLVMESLINQCPDLPALVMQSAQIGNLTTQIERLVASCHKIEGSTGELLDKQILIKFTDSVISIISDEVKDPETVKRIAQAILEVMAEKD